MDEFGIFTESYGLKPQGKLAPMAASKRGNNNITTDTSNHARFSSSVNGAYLNDDFGAFPSAASNTKTQNFVNSGGYSNGSSFNYDSMHKKLNDFGLKSSSMPSYNQNVYGFEDDVFGGMPGLKTSFLVKNDGVFSQFTPAPKKKVDNIDELLGNIGGNKQKSNVVGRKETGEIGKKMNVFDDLIPSFGGRSPLINGKKLDTKSTSTLLEDPFVVLESTSTPANAFSSVFSDALDELGQLNKKATARVLPINVSMHDNMDPFDVFIDTPARSEKSGPSKTAVGARTSIPKIPPFKHPTNGSVPLRPPVKPPQVSKVMSPVVSSIDKLEEFSRGKVRNTFSPSATTLKDATERFESKFIQAKELRERSAKVSRDKESPEAAKDNDKNRKGDCDSIFSATSRSRSAPRSRHSQSNSILNTQSSGGGGTKVEQMPSSSMKKAPSAMNILDDLSSIFGDGLSEGQFDEVEGEPDERRRARLGRHSRTNDRVAQAVADMNQRELQIQREQEERNRISENLDGEIKRWAAGKEGNLRALLSSLQHVLWTGSGWQAVSLTDIITSNSVKKIYRKATLCVHPDKVQQKGANLEQKYVAEKVFDILKEAYNKFNKEELS